ncbi:ABC transporter ATP-binding protein [Luteipulveratus mongoliensis]|uniref:ABC transporter domain-containing protein n=1 Tax=Luteipulveratus mongoliensis TaxID=571913 RepID=A0A0K1JNP0_9MICO|nr:ABC transporter ATP-binding protein [Luteipulveratus mongoliensis]AKU18332.1 hypothetical protein VV02_24945 [Luteipulveratus mongoliensis]
MSEVLQAEGLSVYAGGLPLIEDVSFTIGRGERVGLIGESGSGKSLTALALMGLLPEELSAGGSVRLGSTQIIGSPEGTLAPLRGQQMSMVFQEPMTALNPTMRVGDQVAETMRLHRTHSNRKAARAAAVKLLDDVGLPSPAEAARAYPHQLSGGQRQRVVAAIALANDPELLICDEPTTALDVTVQALVLDLITRGVAARESALLFITHDLGVVATVCDRVLVMYGGRIVEAGEVQDVFTRPQHRYTAGLLAASDLAVNDAGQLLTIPGAVPQAGAFPAGCVFRNRCAAATSECETLPDWTGDDPEHGHACVHPVGVPA